MFKFLLITAVLATIAFLLWKYNHSDDEQPKPPMVPAPVPHKNAIGAAIGKAQNITLDQAGNGFLLSNVLTAPFVLYNNWILNKIKN